MAYDLEKKRVANRLAQRRWKARQKEYKLLCQCLNMGTTYVFLSESQQAVVPSENIEQFQGIASKLGLDLRLMKRYEIVPLKAVKQNGSHY